MADEARFFVRSVRMIRNNMTIQEKIKKFVARQTMVPVAATLLACGQGCASENKRDLNENEQQGVHDMIQYAPDYMMPIIEGLCEAADPETIFGLDGEIGPEACVESLWKIYDNFLVKADAGEIFVYSDPDKTSGAANYTSYGGIGVNEYYNNLFPMGSTEDCPKTGDGHSVKVDFGTILHESAHEWMSHQDELDARQEDSAIYTMSDFDFDKTILEQKDSAYLFSSLGSDPFNLIDSELLGLNIWNETEQAYDNGEITAQEIYDEFKGGLFDYELFAKEIEEKYSGDWQDFYYEFFVVEENNRFKSLTERGFGISKDDIVNILAKDSMMRFNEFRLPAISGYREFMEAHESEIVREGEEDEVLSESEEEKEIKIPSENIFPEGFDLRRRLL